MKNGIPSKTDGFDIVVNDVDRSFRDDKLIAIAAGVYLKSMFPKTRFKYASGQTGL